MRRPLLSASAKRVSMQTSRSERAQFQNPFWESSFGNPKTGHSWFLLIAARWPQEDSGALRYALQKSTRGHFAHVGTTGARKEESMLSKKMAILIFKVGFCVASAIVIWAHPAALFASESSFIPCPPGCKPAGAFHCICP